MNQQEIDAANEALIRAYRVAFASPAGQLVLDDIGRFCFAAGSPFSTQPGETERNVGRNEVWRRICDLSHFTVQEIYALRRGMTIEPEKTDD